MISSLAVAPRQAATASEELDFRACPSPRKIMGATNDVTAAAVCRWRGVCSDLPPGCCSFVSLLSGNDLYDTYNLALSTYTMNLRAIDFLQVVRRSEHKGLEPLTSWCDPQLVKKL